jgi:hypothetical protein
VCVCACVFDCTGAYTIGTHTCKLASGLQPGVLGVGGPESEHLGVPWSL